ncbi:chitin synthase-domain-containing protein [Blyttiomyces helicus]|uniref:chitin synthase n=1 Tax=Blyttiomyces helicus TaxID=388810 RepID=A0A4P9W8T3_9FUNG|nr:chitin synthase-domain-containing protein [Blyttiomyces helicus]|eukprot:RKO86586.1 chitin synthase-domain-containing protein [Blyttiomyces helicus]
MIVIIIPVFNELPEARCARKRGGRGVVLNPPRPLSRVTNSPDCSLQALLAAIISIVECKYSKDRMRLMLSFDDDSESPIFLQTLKNLDYVAPPPGRPVSGDPLSSEGSHPMTLDIIFRGVRVTICRFPHRGKRLTQGAAYALAEKRWSVDLYLFMDSDVQMHPKALRAFVADFEARPGRIAATGLIVCSFPTRNLWWILQETEYVQSQMLDRCLESACGAVTCLPGALTMVRSEALRKVAPLYFGLKDGNSVAGVRVSHGVYEHCRYYLGEDRFLTHLFMESADGPYRIGFVDNALCKTEAPGTFTTLLKQRRRWFLGENRCWARREERS